MSRTTITASPAVALAEVTVDDVRRTYSGKPGCGCGCRGKYQEGASILASRTLKVMRDRASEVGVQRDGDTIIFYLEDEKRFRWLFVASGPVEMRLGLPVAEYDVRAIRRAVAKALKAEAR